MISKLAFKKDFTESKEKLFRANLRQKDSLKFSLNYSLLVEEFIRNLAGDQKFNFALASAGSFSRRELSPYSDIDLMFITGAVEKDEKQISYIIKGLWDNGIEVSHTVRDLSDLKKFLHDDIQTFTQFFETRFLLGSKSIYDEWNQALFNLMDDEVSGKILEELITDTNMRYRKSGDSPKILEPNVKLSAGGLRDFQAIEWMYIIKYKTLLSRQLEISQAEYFISLLREKNYTTPNECGRLLESYRLVMAVRNMLHLISESKNDRFEFNYQKRIANLKYKQKDALPVFMQDYFNAANIIHRFSKAMVKRFIEEIANPLPDALAIVLDEHFVLKGKTISAVDGMKLSMSDILRGFYYRGFYSAHFDEPLRSQIVEVVDTYSDYQGEPESSVFFREILRLPKNVGQTLSVMNELGVLGAFMPEFKDIFGFLQHGVYHCYTTDEHTLMTIRNVEKLDKDSSMLGNIFASIKDKELLYLGLLFHDIAKPINIGGHEIIGAEMASSIMDRLGYSEEEIEQVTFLVKNHLLMEQVAFRRNLNDPDTLNSFTAKFASIRDLDLLYLVTYADLSAVNPAVWTSWKSELLSELYRKSRAMLEEQITGEEYLMSSTYVIPKEITKHSDLISEDHVQEHIESINDIAYAHHFSDEEIARHVEEIRKGEAISVLFKELTDFTNITVITKDSPSLLSKLCGVLSINDANIHDAKIFTRKDGIVIDTFNVTDFRSHKKLDSDRYPKIESDFNGVVRGLMQLPQEFANMKSKWWRIENKFFKRSGKVKVAFEEHEKYTIIDVFSPDRLGFLYQVTGKINELGLNIYFAKISTKGDDIVDSFYVLNQTGKKVSPNEYDLINTELTETINQML